LGHLVSRGRTVDLVTSAHAVVEIGCGEAADERIAAAKLGRRAIGHVEDIDVLVPPAFYLGEPGFKIFPGAAGRRRGP
jgi:hypothetical protein